MIGFVKGAARKSSLRGENQMSTLIRWKYRIIRVDPSATQGQPKLFYKIIEGPPFTPGPPYAFETDTAEEARDWVEEKEKEGGYAR